MEGERGEGEGTGEGTGEQGMSQRDIERRPEKGEE